MEDIVQVCFGNIFYVACISVERFEDVVRSAVPRRFQEEMGSGQTFLFAVVTILSAYLYLKWKPDWQEDAYLNSIESQVVEVWSKEIKWPAKKFSRLAVG